MFLAKKEVGGLRKKPSQIGEKWDKTLPRGKRFLASRLRAGEAHCKSHEAERVPSQTPPQCAKGACLGVAEGRPCRVEARGLSPHGGLDTRGFCTGEIKPQTHSDRVATSSRQRDELAARRAPQGTLSRDSGKEAAFAGDGVFLIA